MRTRIWIGVTLATLLAVVGCDRVPTEPSPVPSQQLAAASELERPPVATPPGLLVSVNWLAENRTRPNVPVSRTLSSLPFLVAFEKLAPVGAASARVSGALLVMSAAWMASR